MSRIGKLPISIPAGVTVTLKDLSLIHIFDSDSSGYYACCTADFKLYVSCILPGNNEGVE